MTNEPSKLVIVQATPFCNINCQYCYLPDRKNPSRMTADTVRHIARFIFRDDSPLENRATILWHAGEPLIVPQEVYRSFFQIFAEENTKSISIDHALQTNGTLLTDSWCELIREWNIKIGVSLDGPEHLHNARRLTRDGRGTFARVMDGIEILRKHSIPFHTISVLSRQSLRQPEAFWEFITRNDLSHVAFNIDEAEGVNAISSMSKSEDCVEDYRHFFSTLLTLRSASGRKIFIRELDFMIDIILKATTNVKGSGLPGRICTSLSDRD
jgi:uncharacterized protein